MDVEEVDQDDELTFAKSLVEEAGKIVCEGYAEDTNFTDKESYADLVTKTDKEVENFIISKIRDKYPHHKVIAEECYVGNAELTDDPTWLIDPIDGTSNFVNRYPFLCISMGLYVNKEPLVAVVFNPITELLYHAKKDCGAFLNNTRIHVAQSKVFASSLVLTDWGGDRTPANLDIKCENFRRLITHARGVRTMGSAALHICQIASGSGDIFFEFGIHCWDYAAGVLIVQEAGGYCCNYDGTPVDLMARNVICAATQEVAQTLINHIKPIHYPRD